MLRMDIQETFYVIPALTQGYVALERIGDFLYNVCRRIVSGSALVLTPFISID